jgi:hypothetical protein
LLKVDLFDYPTKADYENWALKLSGKEVTIIQILLTRRGVMNGRSSLKKIVIFLALFFIMTLGLGCVSDQQMREHREAAEAAMKAAQEAAERVELAAEKVEAAADRAEAAAARADRSAEKAARVFQKGLRK